MSRTDTDANLIESPDFKSANMAVTWRVTASESRSSYPKDHLRRVYVPSDEAKSWDGCESASHALGSRYGGYTYCKITVTGRKLTKSPCGVWGTRCRIVVGICGDPEDVMVISGWVLPPFKN